MSEHDAATKADLDDLASKLDTFAEQLSPGQQAVRRDLLGKAADNPDEVTGFEAMTRTGRHVQPQAATSPSGLPSTPGTPFSVMGVVLFCC